MYSVCSICKESKPATKDFFYQNKNRKKLRYAECKSCFKNRINDRARELKLFALEYKGSKCSVCGYSKNKAALEFHHIDPETKEFKLSNTYVSKENMMKELDKCILLCSNCHRETHYPS